MKFSMDIFCSSPASTSVRSGKGQDNHLLHGRKDLRRNRTNIDETPQKGQEWCNNSSNGSITPKLLRVLSAPFSSSSQLALTLNPINKRDYEQLHKQQQSGIKSSSRRSSSTDEGAEHLQLNERRYTDNSEGSKSIISNKGSTTTLVGRSRSSRHVHQPLTMVTRSSCGQTDPDPPELKRSCSSLSSANHRSTDHKVVDLWVSLHCKGCEAKVRKHISKMKEVKSFSSDLATKRVTIISSMNPHELLASVSTVKYAQFWPATSSGTSNSRNGLNPNGP